MPYRTNNNDDNKIVSALGENFPIIKLYFLCICLFDNMNLQRQTWKHHHITWKKSANYNLTLVTVSNITWNGKQKTYRPVVPMVVCITQGELCIHVIYGFELVEFRPILQSSWDIVIQYIWCRWSVVQYIMILWYSIEPYSAWGRTSETELTIVIR